MKLALRTQQIIAYESGVTKTTDPLGGSYYLETLTVDLEKAVWNEIENVEKLGGAVKAIEKGYVQGQIRESAFRQQMEVESGTKKIVGVNILKDAKQQEMRIHKIDPRSVRKQIANVKSFKRRRQKSSTEKSLRELGNAVSTGKNLVPLIIDSARAGATTGEISDVLRAAYSEFHPKTII